MNTYLIKLCLGGGLFAILAFIHFFVDFIFQSHSEAMIKHNNAKVRAKHCLIYTLGFLPLIITLVYWNAYTQMEAFIAMNVLFWSHYLEDTYLLIVLWAKYIRRPPQMTDNPTDMLKGFKEFIDTTLGKILMIVLDQVVHLAFLFLLVYMALN
jgi:hypothetical protein